MGNPKPLTLTPMQRPQIQNFFPSDTTLTDVLEEYKKSKDLFNYAQALDTYIDHLENKKNKEPPPIHPIADIHITFESCYRGRIEIHTDISTGKIIYQTIIR
jgi:hypothetical protein